MMVVLVTDVLDAIADAAHLQAGRAALAPHWPGIAQRSLDAGHRDIQGCLAAQGLTGAQIASWTDYDSAVLQQALFWALDQGGATLPTPVNQSEQQALDLREWLKTAALLDQNGALILPYRRVGHGVIRYSFRDVADRDPQGRTGFIDPATGTLRRW